MKTIFFNGYEAWREPVEIKVKHNGEEKPHGPMSFANVLPMKGLGRISILLYGLMWSYENLRDEMNRNAELREDFRRLDQETHGLSGL